jgi:3-hydroxyacyl-CoA dehydrogenase/enoyl-CoA hydratase/3-hydroxybutyryl-CoA epimerase
MSTDTSTDTSLMTQKAVITNLDQDGILTITLDMPNRSANVLNDELSVDLLAALAQLEQDTAVKGAILTSAKKDFLAGADIDKVFLITDPIEAMKLADDFKAIIRRFELCGKPVVAAMNGTTLGGGYELAMGCHHRIVINDNRIQIGLPEAKLGLLPGGGGTQRLPRMIGIQQALPLLLEGKSLRPDKALSSKLVDDLATDKADLLAKAKAWCLANPKPQQPWDQKGFRFPGGDSKSPQVAQLWAIAPSMTNSKTQGNFPAAVDIMSCVFEGGMVSFDVGLRMESRYFAHALTSQVAKNMISTFWLQMNALNKGASRPQGVAETSVKKLGVLGAGMMGAGIAYVAAKVGISVVLKDVSIEAAEKGKAYSTAILDKKISKGRGTVAEKDALLSLIHATSDINDLAGCDLVIEAVFENREIKAEVTKATEAVMSPDGVFASNTSTLPITGLAQASVRPANFVGLHFFSPVDKMPLVEIIRGQESSPEAIAKAFDFVRQIKKTPIVVNDGRGFYTSRIFTNYIAEGGLLLKEGQHPKRIDMAAVKAGMPIGPLAVLDEVSLGTPLSIIEQNQKDLGADYKALGMEDVLVKMVRELGRVGKKDHKGFYDYDANGGKKLWTGLAEQFPLSEQISERDLEDRLLFTQVLEAVRAYEEGIVTSIADANIGSIFAVGFAPQHGGVLQFVNAYGVNAFVARAEELAAAYGARFTPPALLHTMAKDNKTFV